MFIFIQQLVIIDVAHNWNESWVDKSNAAEVEEAGSGKRWLGAILVSCATLFGLALAGLIYMFIAFTGCPVSFVSKLIFDCTKEGVRLLLILTFLFLPRRTIHL